MIVYILRVREWWRESEHDVYILRVREWGRDQNMIVYILRVREWWRESEHDCVHTASERVVEGIRT